MNSLHLKVINELKNLGFIKNTEAGKEKVYEKTIISDENPLVYATTKLQAVISTNNFFFIRMYVNVPYFNEKKEFSTSVIEIDRFVGYLHDETQFNKLLEGLKLGEADISYYLNHLEKLGATLEETKLCTLEEYQKEFGKILL